MADGALNKGLKCMFSAAISAVKRDAESALHFVESAKLHGIELPKMESASIGLLISRGMRPYELFRLAIVRAYDLGDGLDPRFVKETTPFRATVDDARSYFEEYFGFIPDYVELLGDEAPSALEGYYLMREAALTETQLPARDMELLLCAVNAAEYQPRFVEIHARGARQAGATESQLVESCLTALPLAGVASWLPASQGILNSRK